jgi:hypothetical protein
MARVGVLTQGLKIRICTEKLKSAPDMPLSILEQFAIALELFQQIIGISARQLTCLELSALSRVPDPCHLL